MTTVYLTNEPATPEEEAVWKLRKAILQTVRFRFDARMEAWSNESRMFRGDPPKFNEFDTILKLAVMPQESLEKLATAIGV